MPDYSLSIVLPAYNEAENLEPLVTEIVAVLKSMQVVHREILIVDDASTDQTANVVIAIAKSFPEVRGIHLRKNTKKAGALLCGYRLAKGDFVITMDTDLEDDPKEIPHLIAALENGADVVNGWRVKRMDSWQKRMSSLAANRLTSFLFGQRLHDMNSGYKAYRAGVLKKLYIPGSLYRFIPHLLFRQGYTVVEIPVNHRPRLHGETKFRLGHRLRYFVDLIMVLFATPSNGTQETALFDELTGGNR